MSSGSFTVTAPHICGELIGVEVAWSYRPGVHTLRNGDPGYPDEWDEEWSYQCKGSCCPKCGVDLDADTIFYATVQAIANREQRYDDPGDDRPDFDAEEAYDDRAW